MKKSHFILFTLLGVATQASAQLIFLYDFEGDFTAKSVNTALVSNVTNFSNAGAAALTTGNNAGTLIGPGTDAAGTDYTLGARDGIYGQSNGYSATFDSTNSNSLYGANAADYTNFSFTANTAFELGTIDFDMAIGGNTSPRGFTVTYNVNGGTFSTLGVAALDVDLAGAFAHYSMDFDNISLSATDTVEVRLLGFSTGAGNSFRFDNVAISAVPEPSIYGIFAGVLVLGLVVYRQRRR